MNRLLPNVPPTQEPERTPVALQLAADLVSHALGVRVLAHEIAPLVGLIEAGLALRPGPQPHHRAHLVLRKPSSMGKSEIATDWKRSAALRAAFIERRYDWQALEESGPGVRAAHALTRIRELSDEGAGA